MRSIENVVKIEKKVGDLNFSVRTAGDFDKGIPVILLHGFPETSCMWEKLMNELANEGYYCIAPDQRGYSPGARPKGKGNYSYDLLVSDVVGIADVFEIDKFHLIGHDWGCMIGWRVAAKYSDRVKSYTAMSVPHPNAFLAAYAEDEEQNTASEYMRDFQTPDLPERTLSENNYECLKASWDTISQEEIEAYIDVFSQEGALTATINWYRENLEDTRTVQSVSVPTLHIWGNEDLYVRRRGFELTPEYVTGDYRFVEVKAGHWLIQEQYEKIKNEIFPHLEQYR